jgi:hypothetical protein
MVRHIVSKDGVAIDLKKFDKISKFISPPQKNLLRFFGDGGLLLKVHIHV